MLTHASMDDNEPFQQEDSSIIEIKALKKIFEDIPPKSTVTLNCKCSFCGNEILMNITSTSGGFGLNGGILREYSFDTHLVICRKCYESDKETSNV
jgi:hypothetical protein